MSLSMISINTDGIPLVGSVLASEIQDRENMKY